MQCSPANFITVITSTTPMFSIAEDSSKLTHPTSTVEFILFDDEPAHGLQQQSNRSNNTSNNYYVFDSDDDELGNTYLDQDSLSTSDGITVLGSPRTPIDSTFVSWNSNWSGRLLNNLIFKRILLLLIGVHSIVVAISTTDYIRYRDDLTNNFWSIRQAFLYLFTAELMLRLIRHQGNIFKSGWLCFDFFVISLSWLLPQILILRTFRVLRSLRHATRFSHLRDIIYALGRAVPNSMAIVGFLSIIFYIFAVIFTSIYKEDFEEFRRLDKSLLTLMQVMTLDEWSQLARRVMAVSPWSWVLFCSFITISSLFLVNFIVAIIIQALVVPAGSSSNNRLDDASAAGAPLHPRDAQRFEAKIDQLVGIVEAIRQKQTHMEKVMTGSTRTAPTVAASFDETLTRDASTVVFDVLKG
jgi:voltage-gated sodium channel